MPRLPTTLAAVASVALAVLALVVTSAGDAWSAGPGPQVLVDAAVGLSCPLVAALAVLRGTLSPGARQLTLVLLAAGVFSAAAAATTALALTASEPTTAARVLAQLQSFLWVPGFLPLLTLVPMLYPDGLLPGRPWRLAVRATGAGTVLLATGVALYPETLVARVALTKPVTGESAARVLAVAGAVLLVPAVAAGLAALVRRVRTRDGVRRRQVALLAGAALVLFAVTAAQRLLPSPLDVLLQAGAVALVPLAIGVAITRHRLYDLDLALCRGLAGLSLAVCLVGAYLTVFGLLRAVTDAHSAVTSAVAAGVTGVVLQPLGRRLGAAVDRAYFGHRADPYVVASRIATRLTAGGLDVSEVPAVVCEALVGGLRLSGAGLELVTAGGASRAATAGRLDGDHLERFPLRHRGEVVAWLVVTPREGERALDERDGEVLRGIADQVAPAVAALQLSRELQSSREHLVAAREAERLRLRQELHDGLGATLAGLRLQVDTARDLVDDEQVAGLLRAAGAGVAHAVAEVRSLTDGLRPPGIDDLGLPGALRALAVRVDGPGLRVETLVDDDLDLDPAVEVAAYRIAAEALANVARHAGAGWARLEVHATHRVVVVVADDGVGLADDRRGGLGLASIRQRAEEVGGGVEVGPGPDGRGTVVRASLPLTVGGPT
jgi:signal transduction histidine kinase